ncbi:TetR/AcrR family transcriptional regulator [Actinopolyspora sp. BKK1]|nr:MULTISPECIES: TetR/AcrR family transcriptional regulator [unclassified Actinopolyspora]NHD15657.1 TetR/AcrR family transcriptional regulator [Actinopolyspora sp. BKK2]NHE75129.1 TetR/AcrR family transcriptional regulator [Actinopolyspora sp. BKK1]
MVVARTVNQQQHQQRREAVTTAAANLFARNGFAKTTTAAIAREAGISTGSLFYYFPDKPAIFRAIFEQDIATSRALLDEHAETEDPVASLLAVVSALATPARDERAPGLLVELLRQVGNDPQLGEVVATNDAIVRDGLAALLRQAATEQRADPDLNAEQAAGWIQTIIDATYLHGGDSSAADPLPMLRLIVTRFLGIDAAPATTTEDDPNAEASR